jgi:hypothetical protein
MVAVVLRVFPSLPADWVVGMGLGSLQKWYEKAIELTTNETRELGNMFHGGEFKSPYLFE